MLVLNLNFGIAVISSGAEADSAWVTVPSGTWISASVHPSSPVLRAHLLLYRSGEDSSSIARVSQASWNELHDLDSPFSSPFTKHASSPLLVKGQVQQDKPFAYATAMEMVKAMNKYFILMERLTKSSYFVKRRNECPH